MADFLKQYPPFDTLPDTDLLELAGSGRVKFHQAGEYVLRQGQEKAQFVWVVQQGRVDLLEESPSREQLRDVLGEGDLLGLDRFLGDGRALHSARTASDVILYGVAGELFAALVPEQPAVRRFLRAHFSLSGVSASGRTSWLDAEAPPEEFLRARLVELCADATHTEVRSGLAQARNRVVALVGDGARPCAVVTAADLASRPCSVALAPPVTTREAVRTMLAERTAEIAVTANGTLDSPLKGILTADELALFSGHNPFRLVTSIRDAGSADEIRPLLRQARRTIMDGLGDPDDVPDCARIAAEVTRALAEFCLKHAPPSPLATCWFFTASSARGESLESGAPTLAAVYEDGDAGTYFEEMSRALAGLLNDCGIEEAAPPCWRSLSEWRQMYRDIIRNPIAHSIFLRREFFDMTPLAGDRWLLESLQSAIRTELDDGGMAVALLANDTLASLPPMTFFRGLVVELDGEQRDSVDIAKTAIVPIADAARVFALARGRVSPAGTLERLGAAAADYPNGAAVFADAAAAFRTAHYYRALAGSGTIAPLQLGKFDQRLLKTAFSSIQRLLEVTDATFVSVQA